MSAHHVLYLSYDGLTDPLGQSQILPYVEGLAALGYRFTLVSFEKPGAFARLRRAIESKCAAAGIRWVPLPYTKTPPILSTLKDLRFLRRTVEGIHRNDPVQLIHCRSYLTSLIALPMKQRHGIPFLFDMRGFWADERVDGRIWNLKNPLYRLIYHYFKRKERDFLLHADAVVSLTHAGKEEMLRWFDEKPAYGGKSGWYNTDRKAAFARKTHVIPCMADLDYFDYHKVSKSRKRWLCAVHGIDPQREYLGYVGSLGTWYMCEEIVLCYAALRKERPDLRFLLITRDNPAGFRQMVAAQGIPTSCVVHVSADRSQMPGLMSLITVAIYFILPAYSKKASSPTKQAELMGMGVPIICNEGVGDNNELMSLPDEVAVLSLIEIERPKPEVLTLFQRNAQRPGILRQFALEHFSLENGIRRFEHIYRILLGMHGPTTTE
jgi:glycosyltransferase involved in cell wall biosynthesis